MEILQQVAQRSILCPHVTKIHMGIEGDGSEYVLQLAIAIFDVGESYVDLLTDIRVGAMLIERELKVDSALIVKRSRRMARSTRCVSPS